MPPALVIVKRVFISLVIGILASAAISEITFLLLRETARPPQDIILNIPAGSAESVSSGEQPPSLPENMVFVVGDVLIVQNEDSVDHQLGPLWIPPGASARLELTTEENSVFECSFQASNYIGLDVRQPITLRTRISGILYAGLPLGGLIALYSLVIPARKKEGK